MDNQNYGGYNGMPNGYNGQPNGGYNGQPYGGGYNGQPNGGYNGMPNGGYNGQPNGGYNGQPNGGYNGMPNGGYNGQPNGGYNGMPNGGYQQGPAAFSPQIAQTVVGKMRSSSTYWLVIGIIQAVIGLPAIMAFGYGVTMIAMGAWNIYQSVKKKEIAAQYEMNPMGMVNYFEGQSNNLIIFLILNIFFGGIIGIAGVIYDMTIKDYVLKNRMYLR